MPPLVYGAGGGPLRLTCLLRGSAQISGRQRRPSLARALGLTGECSCKCEKAVTHGGIVDRVIGINEFDRFMPAQWIGFGTLGRGLGKAARDRGCTHRIRVIKEERDRHV